MSGKYINPEATGYEGPYKQKPNGGPPGVENLYCPYDGHYCEQPKCENCNFEKELE